MVFWLDLTSIACQRIHKNALNHQPAQLRVTWPTDTRSTGRAASGVRTNRVALVIPATRYGIAQTLPGALSTVNLSGSESAIRNARSSPDFLTQTPSTRLKGKLSNGTVEHRRAWIPRTGYAIPASVSAVYLVVPKVQTGAAAG